jgi:hypothetical protein
MLYHSGKQLRAEVERLVGKRLTDAQWARADPDQSFALADADYDEDDLRDLTERVEAVLTEDRPSRDDRLQERARERALRDAEQVRSFVEQERTALWGSPEPPFSDAAEAAAWIESRPAPATMRLTISIDLPLQEANIEGLHALRDWLTRNLETLGEQANLSEFMKQAVGLRSLQFGTAGALPYFLPIDSETTQVGIRRVIVQADSELERVLHIAERVAQSTRWDVVAAVHHLLTGQVLSGAVRSTASYRASRDGPLISSLIAEVRDPAQVDAKAVSDAFLDARARMPAQRRRGRLTRGHEGLVAFVDGQPPGWRARWERWNRDHPGDLFPSHDAMRRAYDREKRRQL